MKNARVVAGSIAVLLGCALLGVSLLPKEVPQTPTIEQPAPAPTPPEVVEEPEPIAITEPPPEPVVAAVASRAKPEAPRALPPLDPAALPASTAPVEVSVSSGVPTYEAAFTGADGGRIDGPDGVQLAFAPSSVVDRKGRPIAGEVRVRWTFIDEPDEIAHVPGRMVTPTAQGELPLQSWGMVNVQVTADVEPRPKLSRPGELSFPLAEPNDYDEDDQIGVYLLDPSGVWTKEGEGVVSDGRFTRVRVTRSGWWNCDAPLTNRGCVEGTIDHEGWVLPEGTVAELVGVDAMIRSYTEPDEAGAFCLDGPPATPAFLRAVQTGEGCFVLESRVVETSKQGSCFRGGRTCTEVTLMPRPVSCDMAGALREEIRLGTRQFEPPSVPTNPDIDVERGTIFAPLTARLPLDVKWASLDCGPLYRRGQPVEAGVVRFADAPVLGDCTLTFGDPDKGFVLDNVGGGEAHTCTQGRKDTKVICRPG